MGLQADPPRAFPGARDIVNDDPVELDGELRALVADLVGIPSTIGQIGAPRSAEETPVLRGSLGPAQQTPCRELNVAASVGVVRLFATDLALETLPVDALGRYGQEDEAGVLTGADVEVE